MNNSTCLRSTSRSRPSPGTPFSTSQKAPRCPSSPAPPRLAGDPGAAEPLWKEHTLQWHYSSWVSHSWRQFSAVPPHPPSPLHKSLSNHWQELYWTKSGCRQDGAMFFGLPLVTFDSNLGSSLAKTRGRRDKWNHIGVITHKRMKIHPCVQTKYTQWSRREQSSQEQKAGGGGGK